MDDTLRVLGIEVLGLAPFWYLFASSSRGHLLGFGPDWSIPRLHEPWHKRTMWAAMGGSLLIVFGLLAGDLPVAVWLLAGGCVLMTGLFCLLAWAVLLDARRRLAFEVRPEAEASPDEGKGE